MMKTERSAGDDSDAATKPDSAQDLAGIEGLIEGHILAKLDPEFLTYFAHSQLQVAGQPTKSAVFAPIQHVREHPEAYQPPCALDTSGFPGVTDAEYLSQDNVKIPVRVYSPDKARHGPGPYPVHLNFHGELSPLLAPKVDGLSLTGLDRGWICSR